MDPELITDNLGLPPNVSQKYGEQITTPKGTKIDGEYRFSKWTHKIDSVQSSERFKDELITLIDYLFARRDFLSSVSSGGGIFSVYLNISTPEHFAFQVPIDAMRKMVEMEINFGFEIFD